MSEIKRLTGKDGKVFKATKGEEVTGDGATALAKGKFYIPTKVAATSSGFPTGTKEDRIIVGDGTSKPASTEKYRELTLTAKCDITSASVEFSNDEVDITTLCDDIMKYAPGFTDATGTIEGITTLDLTEDVISKFVTVQKQDEDGEITVVEKNDDVLILAIELNKTDATDADRAIFFTPAILNGYNLGVQIGEAQTFSSNFRVAQDNDIEPVFLEADKSLFA